jgi:hypothetical protein
MNLFSNIQSLFMTTEKDIIALISKVKTDIVIAETELQAALKWVANNAGGISSNIQTTVGIIETLGAANNPKVAIAIADANTAVKALNAFATSYNSGKGDVNAVIQGYVAVKSAQAASAAAVSAAASTVVAK